MEKSYECLADNGLTDTGLRLFSKYCGCNSSQIYTYFNDLDDLTVQSTEYCMSKIEREFIESATTSADEIERFITEAPHLLAKKHGKEYRIMYQVYTHPKYLRHGKAFFAAMNDRYADYAKRLEKSLGIPYDEIMPFILILIRASVHYALFEDEFYLNAQLDMLKERISLMLEKYKNKTEVNVL